MLGRTIELAEMMSSKTQIADKAPNFEVIVYRAIGDGTYEPFKFILKDVLNVKLDRRWNMAADELQVTISNVNGKYSPDFSKNKTYIGVTGLENAGYKNVFKSFNKVVCSFGYGNELIQVFEGQIVKVDITEKPPTLILTAQNAYRKLLKPIDPITSRKLVYENEKVFEIVKDLCERAGVEELKFDLDIEDDKDFTLNKVTFELGTNYSDAIKTILDTVNHRIVGDREGRIVVLKKQLYSQKDFHHWEFKDCINVLDGTYNMDSALIRNRLIVESSDSWQAFEDKNLIKTCNGEIICACINSPWATEVEQKWAIADDYFMQMRRKTRRISVSVIGNPAMEIGDLVKVQLLTSTATEKYMIVSINSIISESGYIDQVDLEHVNTFDGHLCELAEGDYENDEEEEEQLSTVKMGVRDQIVDYAKSFLGVYYQWGGNYQESKGHYGMDCSHFTYQVLKKFGLMSGYKVAADQQKWCTNISRGELQKGDLVFYTWGGSRVCHVVMYIGNGQIIGANGGGPNTTTKGVAKNQNAFVKIQPIDYGKPAYYGRVPAMP